MPKKQPVPLKATPATSTAKTAAQSFRPEKQSQRKPTPGMQEKLRRKQRVQRPELRLTPVRSVVQPRQKRSLRPDTSIPKSATKWKQLVRKRVIVEMSTVPTVAQSYPLVRRLPEKPTNTKSGSATKQTARGTDTFSLSARSADISMRATSFPRTSSVLFASTARRILNRLNNNSAIIKKF